MKIKLSSDFLKLFEFDELLSTIKYLEITQIYQYDLYTFFSLQRVILKSNAIDSFKAMMSKISKVELFQIIEQKGNEVICVLKQKITQGFWPEIMRKENFAIIPPIQMDPEYIKATIIISETIADQLENVAKLIKTFEILVNTNVQSQHDVSAQPLPHYTERQREIATYAMRQGFYESPKKISAEQIAEHFKISVSAMNEHLRKAERIAMAYFFA
jgi:predicted DNA binding protein